MGNFKKRYKESTLFGYKSVKMEPTVNRVVYEDKPTPNNLPKWLVV